MNTTNLLVKSHALEKRAGVLQSIMDQLGAPYAEADKLKRLADKVNEHALQQITTQGQLMGALPSRIIDSSMAGAGLGALIGGGTGLYDRYSEEDKTKRKSNLRIMLQALLGAGIGGVGGAAYGAGDSASKILANRYSMPDLRSP